MKKGKSSPCSVHNRAFCRKQVISSSTFKSKQSSTSSRIFYEVNCSSAYVIYLMECTLCKKQYIGETGINVHTLPRKKPRFQQTHKVHHCRQTYKYLSLLVTKKEPSHWLQPPFLFPTIHNANGGC